MQKSVKSKKKVFLISLITVLVLATILSSLAATGATDESSSSGLSPDEVSKIMSDIKNAKSSDNIESKLNELMKQAILTGNMSLKEYVEYAKQAHQLQSQLDQVNGSINALCAKSPDISQIDSEVKQTAKSSISVSDVEQTLSSSVKNVLSSLDSDTADTVLDGVENIDKAKEDPSSLSDVDRTILGANIMQSAKDKEVLDENQTQEADNIIALAASALMSSESSKYSGANRSKLIADSQAFAKSANNATAILPEQVVLANTSFRLTSAPIMYNGQILISLNDILQFVKAEVQYTNSNGTLAIQTDSLIVEVTRGKNTGYVNDKSTSMPAPVLTFNGATYIPVEFFAQAFSVSYLNAPDQGVFIMYNNLNQL